MKFTKTGWETLDTVEYHRRLNAFLNRMNSGVDRGDEDATVEHVRKLFDDLAARPLDRAALARNEAAAKKIEDGE